jgi:allantoinase
MAVDLVVRSRRVVSGGRVAPGAVHVEGERIASIAAYDALPAGADVVDAGDAVVMPAVVDTHVHVNEPGRTDWEGFATATRAAAAGGAGTIVDMPLNSIPPTTTLRGLEEKRAAARGQCHVDVGFWGGVVPGNLDELRPMTRAGALGFKCFLIESGVDEFRHVGERELRPAMAELARLGAPLLVHAEVPGPIEAAARTGSGQDPRRYATYLASRPRAAENEAIGLAARLCRETRARTHIVHHSSSDALATLRAAREEGLPLSAETCPHYLRFVAEEIPDGATEFKCAPPIRERENRDALWRALGEGVLSMVASDHSPCSPALKRLEAGAFDAAWGGVAGLQLALPVLWTEASRRGFTLVDLARWTCEEPARLAGLSARKGSLRAGADADLCIFEPEEAFTVTAERILHRHKLTPYLGARLNGVVRATFVRGVRVWDRERGFAARPSGREVSR